jgi:hypothetical protein
MALSDADLVPGGTPKRVLKQMFADRFPTIAMTDTKIGFRVPFDEMFIEGRDRGAMRDYCELAGKALLTECGLRLLPSRSISPRLGWSLVNIGVFLDSHGYRS